MRQALANTLGNDAFRLSCVWWGLFFVFWLAGITGSSLGWYRQCPGVNGMIGLAGERKLFGVYRGIRGDEFIAHGTPNALAQFHHAPQFPRINDRLGLAGRDFLVLHDSGAPVRSPVMLGRPANWGFFFSDLRRSLSWHWLFPIFFAVWSIFLLFRALWEEQPAWRHFLLSFAAVFAPISAAWSFWPAGYAGGTAFGAALAVYTLRGKIGLRAAVPAGIAAGWGGACSALTLYFPGVWPLAVLMAAVVAATAWREKSGFRHWRVPAALFLAAAVLTGGTLLLLWYAETREAIELIAASVYPGQRRTPGGDMPLWTLMRGWLAGLTIYKLDFGNQCEMQHALMLVFPLAVLAAWSRELRRNVFFRVLAGFMIFTLGYQHLGFPAWLAAATGFDRCTGPRIGMAQSLAQMLMLGALLSLPNDGAKDRKRAGIAAAALTILLGLFWLIAPADLWQGLLAWHPKWRLGAALAVIAGLYAAVAYLLFRRPLAGVLLFAAANLLPGLVFNPVCIAPAKIENRLAALIPGKDALPCGGRMLVATGNDFAAVAAFLAGNRTLNGYFMYMDKGLQKLLFDRREDPAQFRRMNHLDAELKAMDGPAFRAEVTHPERILLEFDPARYDFRQLPIDLLAAPQEHREALAGNRSLKARAASADGLDYWLVDASAR